MKTTDIVFRKVHQEEANHHAEIACKNRGISIDDEKYHDEYNIHFKKYLDDVKTSMTTDHSALLDEIKKGVDASMYGENPTSPKVAEYIWSEFPSFQKDGFFDRFKGKYSSEEIEQKKAQFKGAILSLANLFLELKAEIKTKGKNRADLTNRSELSDFQYRKWPKDSAPNNKILEDRVQVEINRYNRMYVVTYLMFVLDRMMAVNSFNVAKELLEKSDLFAKDENGKITFNSISKEKSRKQWIKLCRKKVEQEYIDEFTKAMKLAFKQQGDDKEQTSKTSYEE